jgi:hypothetical protein
MNFRDYGEITDRKITTEGFLEVGAKVARSGVQEYYAGEFVRDELPLEFQDDPNMVLQILRPEAEVFDERVLQAFAHRPVTDGHPREFVNSQNVKDVQVGFSKHNVRRDGSAIAVDLVVQDQQMIKQVREGQNQLSAGYKADVIWASGTDDQFGVFDAKMTNIQPNHIAIVDVARGGSELTLNDSWPANKQDSQKNKTEDHKMATRVIDGITVEFSDQAAEAFDKKAAELEAKQGELDATSQKMTDMQAQIDKLQGLYDAEKENALKSDELDALVSDRMQLIDAAKKIAPKVDFKGLGDSEIKAAAIKVAAPTVDLTGKSADYVTAMFDSFAMREVKDKGLEKLNEGLKDDGELSLADEARKKFRERSENAWKKPFTATEVN